MGIRSLIQPFLGSRDPKPHFRFHPSCYDDGILRKGDELCVVCRKPDQWLYYGGVYSIVEESPVCAPCIAGDCLRFKFGKNFSFHDAEFSDEAGHYEKEVMQLTPGFGTVNPFVWPLMDGVPMAYLGRGEERHFWENATCRAAMQQFWRQEQEEYLDGPTPHLMVFQSLNGSQFGFYIDWC